VTFSTDIFHPLITPLTTYTYSTDIPDGGTVSATDKERLPPGGFSLRHGFPGWFGRETRRRQVSIQPDATGAQLTTPDRPIARGDGSVGSGSNTDRSTPASAINGPNFMRTVRPGPSTYEVLAYILSTFSSEATLDAIPLEAAGNPGAWHAWRTQRGLAQSLSADERWPGQWNWEGVWEERVKKGIASSLSEAVLFGGAEDVVSVTSLLLGERADHRQQINFLNVEELDIEAIKDDLARTVEAAR
jgi:hypothetical protein